MEILRQVEARGVIADQAAFGGVEIGIAGCKAGGLGPPEFDGEAHRDRPIRQQKASDDGARLKPIADMAPNAVESNVRLANIEGDLLVAK